jgi:hypothetical protein
VQCILNVGTSLQTDNRFKKRVKTLKKYFAQALKIAVAVSNALLKALACVLIMKIT